ncbi:apolipoprotein C-II [Felis catus]|uniref:apolipoprotein C-II n=1 Tax=Felis catus TaxID=9685 RepID=UPI00017A0E6E|nr:apolipoprotein C-II [Felis catus]
MGTRCLLVPLLVLLVLRCDVQGDDMARQDEATGPTLLSKMQESLYGYWGSAKAAAQDLYKKTYLTTVDEKIRDMYSTSTAAVRIYTGILTDQILSMLSGDS